MNKQNGNKSANTASWLFGVITLLIGITRLPSASLSALCYIAISFLLLPPLRNLVHKKTNILIPTWGRGVAIVLLIIISGMALQWSEEAKQRNVLAQQAERKITKDILTKSHFESNKEGIISSIKSSIESQKYNEAISLSKKYLVSGDEDLIKLHNQTKQHLARIQKARQEEISKIKQLVGTTTKDNPELYEKYGMPDTLKGTNNFRWIAYYPKGNFTIITTKKTDIIQEVIIGKMSPQALKNREVARQKKIEANFSQWDGSHVKLTQFIKEQMNDPSSYDHIETKYWDNGYNHIVIFTTYRGKNSYGAIVKGATRAKVSIDGQVLEILE